MPNPTLQVTKITYGDALKSQAGKNLGSPVPSEPKPDAQTQHSNSLIPVRGNYGPTFPYPAQNYFSAQIEVSKNIRRQNTFGQLALHTVKQGALYLTNPTNANIVNPLIVTGQLPGEGLIPTSIDAIYRDPIAVQAKNINNPTFGAAVRANIGQTEGPSFAPQFPPSVGQAIDFVADKIMGALGMKDNSGDAAQSPKQNTLQGRLSDSNRLFPSDNPVDSSQGVTVDKDSFNYLYGVGRGSHSWRADQVPSENWTEKLGGQSKEAIARFYAPIQGGDGSDLSSDFPLAQNNEDGWKSNLGYQSVANPENNSASPFKAAGAKGEQPQVLDRAGTMVFPFYFESLNHFTDTPEQYITFQATFANLREEYRPLWNQKRFFGRSTAVYIYEATDRNVSFDFLIHTPERSQLGVMKQRINWLARHVYPSYLRLGKDENTARIIFEAPIIKFTIGDLFRNTPGIIKTMTYDWDINGSNRWELSKDIIMPQMVKVTISIDILHNKFMQNSALPLVDFASNESSDFYEFIRPDLRGIEPITQIKSGDKDGSSSKQTIADFTPTEADAFAGEQVYG